MSSAFNIRFIYMIFLYSNEIRLISLQMLTYFDSYTYGHKTLLIVVQMEDNSMD